MASQAKWLFLMLHAMHAFLVSLGRVLRSWPACGFIACHQ